MIASRVALILGFLVAGCGGKTAPPSTNKLASSAQPANAELTTAKDVIERAIAVQGGRDAFAKIRSLKQTGTLTIPQMGATGSMTIYTAAPRSSFSLIDIPGIGKITQGVRDDLVWEMNPMTGSRIVVGTERAQLLREATFHADLTWQELYPTAELAGVVDFAGTKAYKVVLTAKEGDTQTRYYAKDTLLPIGVEMTIESQMGKVPNVMKLSDHREVGGFTFPHKMVRDQGPVSIEITLQTIEPNAEIPPGTFDVPPEIQQLQKK